MEPVNGKMSALHGRCRANRSVLSAHDSTIDLSTGNVLGVNYIYGLLSIITFIFLLSLAFLIIKRGPKIETGSCLSFYWLKHTG